MDFSFVGNLVLGQTPAPDGLTPLYLLVGTLVVPQLIGAVFAVVKWMGSRTVEREDKDKEAILERLDAQDKRASDLEKIINGTDRAIGTVQLELKQALSTVESVRGMITEIRETVDMRFEKQGDFYRSQIKELTQTVEKKTEETEYKLRQELQMLRDSWSSKRRR